MEENLLKQLLDSVPIEEETSSERVEALLKLNELLAALYTLRHVIMRDMTMKEREEALRILKEEWD